MLPTGELTSLVDSLPFLKFFPGWLPGIKFHKIADKGRVLARDVIMGPYKEIKTQVVGWPISLF